MDRLKRADGAGRHLVAAQPPAIAAMCRDRNIALASHDDAT
jgi:alpha-D-ribose 1-methylphosphonate 5-triphosphate diphosphatase PhnM